MLLGRAYRYRVWALHHVVPVLRRGCWCYVHAYVRDSPRAAPCALPRLLYLSQRSLSQVSKVTTFSNNNARHQESCLADGLEEDEWASISALESSRREQEWRQHLSTPEQLEQESDLDKDWAPGEKLVDRHDSDLELWHALLEYRQHFYGIAGGKSIWKHLAIASTTHKMRLWELPRLWRRLEELALQDEEVLQELIGNVRDLSYLHKDRPDGFYERIIFQRLSEDGTSAIVWHNRMKGLYPNKREVKSLFQALCDQPGTLELFKSFCFDIPAFSDMYSYIIPYLAQRKMLVEAVAWHSLLLEHNDLPPDFDAAERLLRQLTKNGHNHLAHKVARELTDAGTSGGRKWLRAPKATEAQIDSTTCKHDQVAGLQESCPKDDASATKQKFPGLFQDVPAKQLSDQFVARLFATRFFSLITVARGLNAININSIGPLTLREIVLRIADGSAPKPDHVAQALSLLQEVNIDPGVSTFSRLLIKLAKQNDQAMLQDVMASDQHPDVIEDRAMQETLLMSYIEQGRQRDANRTMAILAVDDTRDYSSEGTLANLQLKHACAKGNPKVALRTLQAMIAKRQKVLYGTQISLQRLLLVPRRPGHAPNTFVELDTAVNIFTMLMRTGRVVHFSVWIELNKRLGWAQKFDQLERVCVFLVKWYLDDSFRRATSLPGARHYNWKGHLLTDTTHPLRRIFNKHMYQGIITWGFTSGYLSQPAAIHKTESLVGSHEDKVATLIDEPSFRGLRLLRRLKDLGLPFDESEHGVAHACKLRLKALFGPGVSSRIIQRRIKMGRKAAFVDYAAAMESIWGEQLFYPRTISEHRLQTFAYETLQGAIFELDARRLRDTSAYDRRLYSLSETPEYKKYQWVAGGNGRRRRRYTAYRRDLPTTATDEIVAKALPTGGKEIEFDDLSSEDIARMRMSLALPGTKD